MVGATTLATVNGSSAWLIGLADEWGLSESSGAIAMVDQALHRSQSTGVVGRGRRGTKSRTLDTRPDTRVSIAYVHVSRASNWRSDMSSRVSRAITNFTPVISRSAWSRLINAWLPLSRYSSTRTAASDRPVAVSIQNDRRTWFMATRSATCDRISSNTLPWPRIITLAFPLYVIVCHHQSRILSARSCLAAPPKYADWDQTPVGFVAAALPPVGLRR